MNCVSVCSNTCRYIHIRTVRLVVEPILAEPPYALCRVHASEMPCTDWPYSRAHIDDDDDVPCCQVSCWTRIPSLVADRHHNCRFLQADGNERWIVKEAAAVSFYEKTPPANEVRATRRVAVVAAVVHQGSVRTLVVLESPGPRQCPPRRPVRGRS